MAAIQFKNFKVMDYVNNYYSRDTYGVCYDHKVASINGIDMWLVIEFDEIQPPKYKKGPGRPKKLRREPGEDPSRTRLREDPTLYKCIRYRATSYNTRRCPLPPPVVPEEENEEPSGAAKGVAEVATQYAIIGVQYGPLDVVEGGTEGGVEASTEGVTHGGNEGAPVGAQTQHQKNDIT